MILMLIELPESLAIAANVPVLRFSAWHLDASALPSSCLGFVCRNDDLCPVSCLIQAVAPPPPSAIMQGRSVQGC